MEEEEEEVLVRLESRIEDEEEEGWGVDSTSPPTWENIEVESFQSISSEDEGEGEDELRRHSSRFLKLSVISSLYFQTCSKSTSTENSATFPEEFR